MSNGLDYGMRTTNIDPITGIRFGVIPEVDVGEVWYEQSELDYGNPTCPKCGNDAKLSIELDPPPAWIFHSCADAQRQQHPYEYGCLSCQIGFHSDEAYPDEPHGSYVDNDEYKTMASQDGDIFVLKSPYYTYAKFCSPCAPGAIYLMNPLWNDHDNILQMSLELRERHRDYRGYCFGHEWFQNDVAPYPVYRVSDNQLVEPGDTIEDLIQADKKGLGGLLPPKEII